MAIVPFNHNQKEYRVVEQMLENYSNAVVVHPMGTNKSMIDGELAEAPRDVSFQCFSYSADIFKTSCESVRRNSPEKALFWTALFTYVKRLCCSRQKRETMAAQKPDFIILNVLHRVCVSHRNVPVKPLLALRPQTKLLRLTATAIRYLDAQKNSVEHFFGDCIANEMTLGEDIVRGFLSAHQYGTTVLQYRHRPGIDVSRVYAAKHGNLQAPKFCVPPGGLELGAWTSNQIIARKKVHQQAPPNEDCVAQLDQTSLNWRSKVPLEYGYEQVRQYGVGYESRNIPVHCRAAGERGLGIMAL